MNLAIIKNLEGLTINQFQAAELISILGVKIKL